jgi:DNA-directed RNA polymerase sigma subunit (sigma70/sigma32)
MPEGTHLFIISVARRYQRQGLGLTELVEAGEDGWQRARRYYGEDTDNFERWGFHWVQESMLMAVYQNETSTEPER